MSIDSEELRYAAHHAHGSGWGVVLLKPGTKQAAFKNWQERLMDLKEIDYWMRRYAFNIGLRLGSNVCVIDKDAASRDAYNRLRKLKSYRSSMEVQTSKGIHVYGQIDGRIKEVRSRIRWQGLPVDVLMGKRYVVAPPSIIKDTDFRYAYRRGTKMLPPAELPMLSDEMVNALNDECVNMPTLVSKTDVIMTNSNIMTNQLCNMTGAPAGALRDDPIRDIRGYICSIPSVMGENGSRGLMRVCYLLAERFDWPTALAELVAWNAEVPVPPWDVDKELVRALSNAFRKKWGDLSIVGG